MTDVADTLKKLGEIAMEQFENWLNGADDRLVHIEIVDSDHSNSLRGYHHIRMLLRDGHQLPCVYSLGIITYDWEGNPQGVCDEIVITHRAFVLLQKANQLGVRYVLEGDDIGFVARVLKDNGLTIPVESSSAALRRLVKQEVSLVIMPEHYS